VTRKKLFLSLELAKIQFVILGFKKPYELFKNFVQAYIVQMNFIKKKASTEGGF